MTNEPTTESIVQALRCSADDDSFCRKCQYGYALGSAFLCDRGRMNQNASDRLESQAKQIAELTARAESAEAERDAAVADIKRLQTKQVALCSICEFEDMIGCAHKNHCDGFQLFRRRGLQPQDGVK